MRLSFSQLEAARKNPARFGSRFSGGGGYFNSNNFRTYLLAAINRFHRGESKKQVLHFFEEKCRTKLGLRRQFQGRLAHYLKVLGDYCDGFSAQGCQFVESHKSTSLVLGNHMLTGKIDRFDVRIPTGYRATAGQLRETDWESELRWPLIQKAIAQEINCPATEVEVGVFCFENGRYEYRTFTPTEIAAAQNEANSVLTTVAMHIPSNP
jgi:hypothetical protein